MPEISQVEDFVDRSKIIFRGTVEKLASTTVPTFSITSSTVVVRVDQLLHAPETLGILTGDRITVKLGGPPGMRVGDQAIFFTIPRVYAESVAVDEVGRLRMSSDRKSQRDQFAKIKEATAKLPDRHVQRRTSDADLVVIGKVSSVTAVRSRQRYPIARHDPDWQEATVVVESVERGRPPGRSVVVLFPESSDLMWKTSPKFHVGQEGLWILRKQEIKILKARHYLALDPGDFHRKDQKDRIRKLMKAI